MIRKCGPEDIERIYFIINEAAKVYKGVIPPDRYHEPYMSMDELRQEITRCLSESYESKHDNEYSKTP